MELADNYLASIRKLFRYYKGMGEKAMAQLSDEELLMAPDPESMNIAMIVKHISGNMRSRWTDFLTADGEKPWRNRKTEFANDLQSREEIMAAWEKGWACLLGAVDPLQPEDLLKIIYIRNEGHTALEAINRQFTHYSYHIGQIVYQAKHLKGADWQSLSIPKGQSETFNQKKFAEDKRRKHFL